MLFSTFSRVIAQISSLYQGFNMCYHTTTLEVMQDEKMYDLSQSRTSITALKNPKFSCVIFSIPDFLSSKSYMYFGPNFYFPLSSIFRGPLQAFLISTNNRAVAIFKKEPKNRKKPNPWQSRTLPTLFCSLGCQALGKYGCGKVFMPKLVKNFMFPW